VARKLLEGNRHTPNYSGIPSVVFTTPPLARVGLLEEAARAQGLRFTTHHEDTSSWYSSRRVALRHTGFKTLVEEGTERILGAHLLGPHAEEIINLFTLAICAGSLRLISSIWSMPTPRARQMWATCSNRSCAALHNERGCAAWGFSSRQNTDEEGMHHARERIGTACQATGRGAAR
jgi:hypothetical protein